MWPVVAQARLRVQYAMSSVDRVARSPPCTPDASCLINAVQENGVASHLASSLRSIKALQLGTHFHDTSGEDERSASSWAPQADGIAVGHRVCARLATAGRFGSRAAHTIREVPLQ
jgi:hypothetical protein